MVVLVVVLAASANSSNSGSGSGRGRGRSSSDTYTFYCASLVLSKATRSPEALLAVDVRLAAPENQVIPFPHRAQV